MKENARIRNEQDADPLRKALKLRILHEEYDKHLSKQNQEEETYYAMEKELSWKMEYSCENTTGKRDR